jgi:hypothetical protein
VGRVDCVALVMGICLRSHSRESDTLVCPSAHGGGEMCAISASCNGSPVGGVVCQRLRVVRQAGLVFRFIVDGEQLQQLKAQIGAVIRVSAAP